MLFCAIVGIVLPLLPTVPFLIFSAFFFAKSSERMHTWLVEHKVFGKMISDWHQRGAIHRKAKYFATFSIGLVILVSLLVELKAMILAIQFVVLSLVLVFIWTRPES